VGVGEIVAVETGVAELAGVSVGAAVSRAGTAGEQEAASNPRKSQNRVKRLITAIFIQQFNCWTNQRRLP
jgi:F0F1-type ATP synthase membrane subunit c/vacuolar-type H+-ATPase subunit K